MIVSHADDGFTAIAALERAWHFGCPFDLAIVDYMMPGLSGDQIAARIRAIPAIAEIKLILSSSAGGHGLPPTAAADVVLAKPLREHDLLECFAKLFGGAVTAGSQEAAPAVPQDPAEGVLRILIVEDNSINQRLLSVLLAKAGHDVTLAENGQQAVDAVEAQDFDVVLMDVQMPVMDGVEATRRIRALPTAMAKVRIIALTAHAMEGAKREYLAAGMDDYLSKPIVAHTMLAMLARVKRPAGPRDSVAATPGAPAAPLAADFDPAPIASLAEFMAQADVDELVDGFVTGMTARLEQIAALASAGDCTQLARDAHDLISIAGNFGARRCEALARALEQACQRGDSAGASRLVAEIGLAFAAARRDLLRHAATRGRAEPETRAAS
jgi:CheY-like chemotaxis protein